MTNPYDEPNNQKSTHQAEKFDFIFDMYKLELKDTEIIQSKLKFFIGLIISSLLAIFLSVEKFAHTYFFETCGLTIFFVLNLIILNIICFYLIYKVFSLKDYEEISELMQEDLEKDLNTFYKENNQLLIELFNKNKIININRRKGLKILFILYYIIGILHLFWFGLYLIGKIFT